MKLPTYIGKGIVTIAFIATTFFLGCNSQTLKSQPPKPNATQDKYAVLVGGSTEERHEKNLTRAFKTLLANGFEKQNIYILDSTKEKKDYPINGVATKETIENKFRELSEIVDEEDTLFVYFTGHGIRKLTLNLESPLTSRLQIKGKDLRETDLEAYLSKITPKVGILIFDQCYGGGFAERTGKGKFIAISASESQEQSNEATFPQAFFDGWKSYKGIRPKLSFKGKRADINRDGKVSIGEAFDYAKPNDDNTRWGLQHPQIFSGEADPYKTFLK